MPFISSESESESEVTGDNMMSDLTAKFGYSFCFPAFSYNFVAIMVLKLGI